MIKVKKVSENNVKIELDGRTEDLLGELAIAIFKVYGLVQEDCKHKKDAKKVMKSVFNIIDSNSRIGAEARQMKEEKI